jgi:hypothetical protein
LQATVSYVLCFFFYTFVSFHLPFLPAFILVRLLYDSSLHLLSLRHLFRTIKFLTADDIHTVFVSCSLFLIFNFRSSVASTRPRKFMCCEPFSVSFLRFACYIEKYAQLFECCFNSRWQTIWPPREVHCSVW